MSLGTTRGRENFFKKIFFVCGGDGINEDDEWKGQGGRADGLAPAALRRPKASTRRISPNRFKPQSH
jgi:hypothetical protein